MKKRIYFFSLLLVIALVLTLNVKRENPFLDVAQVEQPSPIPSPWSGASLTLLSSEISPNGLFRADSYRGSYADKERYYQVFITNLRTSEKKLVFSGDPRTSGWEWTKDKRIKIVYNCGTGCEASKILGVNDSISFEDYKDGGMSKENGWVIKFFE